MPRVSTSTVKSAGVTIDLEDFRKLARQMRKASVDLNSEVRKMLRAMGAIVAEEAKSQAADYSTTIPAGIKVRVSGMTVSVVSTVTPIGGLLEMAAKSHPGVTWRHPVFGNRSNWVAQQAHPYLLPALRDKAEEVESATARIVGLVLDRALEE